MHAFVFFLSAYFPPYVSVKRVARVGAAPSHLSVDSKGAARAAMGMQSKIDEVLGEFDASLLAPATVASDKRRLESLGSRLFDAADHHATGKMLRKDFTEVLLRLADWLGRAVSVAECHAWFAGADEHQIGNLKHHAFQTVLRKFVLAGRKAASVFICADVALGLKVNLEDLTYKVKWRGDADLEAVFGGLEPEVGALSMPMSLHSLPPALAGAPARATHCAFAYPLVNVQVCAPCFPCVNATDLRFPLTNPQDPARYPPPLLYKLRPCPSYSRCRDRINLGPNFNSVPNVVQPHKTWVG